MNSATIREFERIVQKLSHEKLSSIECDILLGHLRKAYDSILNAPCDNYYPTDDELVVMAEAKETLGGEETTHIDEELLQDTLDDKKPLSVKEEINDAKEPEIEKVEEQKLEPEEVESFEAVPEDVEEQKSYPEEAESFEPSLEEIEEKKPVLEEVEQQEEISEILQDADSAKKPIVTKEMDTAGTLLEQTDQMPKSENVTYKEEPVNMETSRSESERIVEQNLFGEIEPIAPKRNRKSVIMSLYGHDARVQNVQPSNEGPSEKLAVADASILSELLFGDKTTVSDVMSENSPSLLGESIQTSVVADTIPTTESLADDALYHTSLMGSLSVAESMILKRELFYGDDELFERTLSKLDSLPTFEDCIIYIEENLQSNRPSIKILTSLLDKKFS
ncbi:MAG: hypothetical protein KBS95_02660 [Alistipes sp.]|nr:hypothetical protein [Candidatus Alistipes equi]